jgi:hypothetical protein
MDAHGDAAAVVLDPDDVVSLEDDDDVRADTGQRLVDRIVHYLVNEVVETVYSRRAYVHARALSYRFKPFEYLYTVR